LAKLAIEETNIAYANSGITVMVLLVHADGEDSYIETSNSNTLYALKGQTDGDMDGVHRKRLQYGADIVAMIGSVCCGIGYVGPSPSYMFSVSYYGYATGYYTFGHEIGHNLGCYHNRNVISNGGTNCDSSDHQFGYQDPQARFRSILAYGCNNSPYCDGTTKGYCNRVQMFSNSMDNRYNNMIIGDSNNDNTRRINDVSANVAKYFYVIPTVSPVPTSPPTVSPVPTSSPTAHKCNDGKISLRIEIKTDKYPAEVSCNVKNSIEEIVFTCGTYSTQNALETERTCLSSGSHTFTINDSYGDGICCEHGRGDYTLTYDGVEIINGDGDFGDTTSHTFGESSPSPSSERSPSPSSERSPSPSSERSPSPSSERSESPSSERSQSPSSEGSQSPSSERSQSPSSEGSLSPSSERSPSPSSEGSESPSSERSQSPSSEGSQSPSSERSQSPSSEGSQSPSSERSQSPSSEGSLSPSFERSDFPSSEEMNKLVRIQSLSTGFCLEVGGVVNKLIVGNCAIYTNAQLWFLGDNGSIKHKETGTCLTDELNVKDCALVFDMGQVFVFNKFHQTLISAKKNKAIYMKVDTVMSTFLFNDGVVKPKHMWSVEY